MKLSDFFTKNKEKIYFDLSSRDRKKIVTGAIRAANIEQSKVLKDYGDKQLKCRV